MKRTPPAPLRVLVLNHNVMERGTYFRSRRIALGLARMGDEVTFITTSRRWFRSQHRAHKSVGRTGGTFEEWATPSWAPVFDEDGGWSPLGLLWRLRIALFQRRRFDVVFCFSHKPIDQIPARLVRRFHGARWLCDWCDLWGTSEGLFSIFRQTLGPPQTVGQRIESRLERVDARLEICAVRNADLLTVICRSLEQRALRLRGGQGGDVLRLVSGADTQHISPREKRQCRTDLGLPAGEGPWLGYIANWYPDEGFFWDAMDSVAAQIPNVRVIVAGPSAHPPPGLRDRVHQLGRVPFAQIPAVLGAADVLVLPLRDTAFNRCRWPNKIGDYLAAGRPLVACDVGDVDQMFQDVNCQPGVLCAATSKALAQGLCATLNDAEDWAGWGENARSLAERQLSWRRLVWTLRKRLASAD